MQPTVADPPASCVLSHVRVAPLFCQPAVSLEASKVLRTIWVAERQTVVEQIAAKATRITNTHRCVLILCFMFYYYFEVSERFVVASVSALPRLVPSSNPFRSSNKPDVVRGSEKHS